VKNLASVLIISIALAASAFAATIEGKKSKEVTKVEDGLEFRVIDIAGTSRYNPKGYLKIEITNKADSLVEIDLSNFAVMNIDEQLVRVTPKQMLRNDGLEMTSDRIFEPMRKIKAGKTLKINIPFMGPLVLTKVKPIKLYWDSILLFDIYE